ncbi:MAG TPA: PAS domain S-box protein, partial [Terriglobales bacterium]|nr:PAS domain S-box protein [Terriglobales bacterium]
PQSDNRELDLARQMQRYVVENVRSAIIMLDFGGTVVAQNAPAMQLFGATERAIGGSVYQSPYVERCPHIVDVWQQAMADVAGEPRRFQCKISVSGEERSLDILIRPLLTGEGQRTGCLIICDDVSPHEKLRTTIEELETTAEELHSANEELETTNEELQSTNEELETTNEELHSLNEELETTNEELEMRTRDLEESTTRYAETLAQMPSPIAVVNDNAEIQLWNSAAERLFNLASAGVKGLKLKQLPIASRLRTTLVRRHESVLRSLKPALVRDFKVTLDGFNGPVNLRFTPISSSAGKGVLIVFDPQRPAAADGSRRRRDGKTAKAPAKQSPAKASGQRKKD